MVTLIKFKCAMVLFIIIEKMLTVYTGSELHNDGRNGR